EKSYIHPLDRGFDEFFGYTDAVHAWQKFPKQLWHGRELKDVKGDAYADSLFTDKSIDFAQRNKGHPSFLYLAFVAPHLHLPALVCWPGKLPAGKTSDDPVHMTDLFPTLLAAARGKADPAWKLDGRNLLPVWLGEEKAPVRTLFWEWRSEKHYQIAAMRGPIKFIIPGLKALPEMYDVVNDPAETRNIIAEHPELARTLEQELRTWL